MGSMKQTTRGKLFSKSTIYGKDGEHATPYMTRYFFGRLRFHIFHRPDADEDCHNHPWGFWTFPFTSYVEEVATKKGWWHDDIYFDQGYELSRNVVRAWRLHYRPADYTHRVLGAWSGDQSQSVYTGKVFDDPIVAIDKPIYTLVLRDGWSDRSWGFLKNRNGKWCWSDFKSYVYGGGKNAPCQD